MKLAYVHGILSEYIWNSHCCTVVSYCKYNIGRTRLCTKIRSCLTSVGFYRGSWMRIVCLLEWFLFLFVILRPNLYSRLCSKSLEGFMCIALVSLIKGHWRISIYDYIKCLWALVQGTDLFWHFYLSILGLLDKGIRTAPHTYSLFCYVLILYPVFHMCAVCNLIFKLIIFVYWIFLSSPKSFPVYYEWGT